LGHNKFSNVDCLWFYEYYDTKRPGNRGRLRYLTKQPAIQLVL